MNCTQCNQHLDKHIKFCPNCGNKVASPIDPELIERVEKNFAVDNVNYGKDENLEPTTIKQKSKQFVFPIGAVSSLTLLFCLPASIKQELWILVSLTVLLTIWSSPITQNRLFPGIPRLVRSSINLLLFCFLLNAIIAKEEKNKARELVSIAEKLFENEQFNAAWSTAQRFTSETYRRSPEAKSLMEAIRKKYAPIRERELLTIVKSVPYEEFSKNLTLYSELVDLAPQNKHYRSKQAQYQGLVEHQREKKSAVLILTSFRFTREHSYSIMEGTVKNNTNKPIDNVMAVAEVYDLEGNFITSESALIEYNPLLPKQISPFKVMIRDNPEIKRGSVSFKTMFGGTLDTYTLDAR